MIRYIC